jgi:CMP-N,N'-diacetyllegionaminic acid synthase
VARSRGAEVPFLRPAHLAGDASRVADALADVIERLDDAPETFVVLQPTSPLRTAADVDAALALLDETGADSVVGVCETSHLLFCERDGRLELASDGAGLIATNRQELAPAYRLNGAVYAARTASFLERRSLLTGHLVAYPMPRWRSVDIDELEDFTAAELLLRAA